MKTSGFSLIGVIVAIFVLSVGMIGILDLSQASLRAASLSQARLVTSGLAQEGIEIIRYMRRTQSDWDDWYSAVPTGDYLVQYNSSNLLSFSEIPLKFNTISGLYQYDSGDDSQFYRKISLTKISSNEVKVVVEVKWQRGGVWRNLTAEDRLWNWK